ncbi:MAG TPA: hypothetical protein VN113_02720, partial [Caulobacter sp.]|nr:hypothetical protein [Caulobacter sp.]
MSRKLALAGILGCVATGAAHAQDAKPAAQSSQVPSQVQPRPKPTAKPATAPKAAPKPVTPEDLDTEVEAVTITATGKPYGAVLGDIPPEETFTAADVRSFGVSSIDDLLTELTPQTTSGLGGDPVVLLNGRRISGQGEIRDIPTEAIARVEILPEEVALKYGYSADQKVVNIVLRQRFRSTTAQVTGTVPTQGGEVAGAADLTQFSIEKNGRTTLNAHVEGNSLLTEDERNICLTQERPCPTADQADGLAARSLVPSKRDIRAG